MITAGNYHAGVKLAHLPGEGLPGSGAHTEICTCPFPGFCFIISVSCNSAVGKMADIFSLVLDKTVHKFTFPCMYTMLVSLNAGESPRAGLYGWELWEHDQTAVILIFIASTLHEFLAETKENIKAYGSCTHRGKLRDEQISNGCFRGRQESHPPLEQSSSLRRGAELEVQCSTELWSKNKTLRSKPRGPAAEE